MIYYDFIYFSRSKVQMCVFLVMMSASIVFYRLCSILRFEQRHEGLMIFFYNIVTL